MLRRKAERKSALTKRSVFSDQSASVSLPNISAAEGRHVPERRGRARLSETQFVTVGFCAFHAKYAGRLSRKPITRTIENRLQFVGFALSTIANWNTRKL